MQTLTQSDWEQKILQDDEGFEQFLKDIDKELEQEYVLEQMLNDLYGGQDE